MENETRNLIFIPPWSATQGQGFWGATRCASHSISVEYAVTAAARELNPHILFHTVSACALSFCSRRAIKSRAHLPASALPHTRCGQMLLQALKKQKKKQSVLQKKIKKRARVKPRQASLCM